MSISEVLLFIATNSRACVPCMEFVRRHNFPVKVVRLDSDEARTAAANGTYFQVTVVPTMIVIYEDGNTQLFIGASKITQWLGMLISRANSTQDQEGHGRGVTSYLPAGGNMYGPRPNPPRPARFVDDPRIEGGYRSPAFHSGVREQDDLEEDEGERYRRAPLPKSRVVVEEDEPEEEAKEEPKRKKSSKSRKPPSKESQSSKSRQRKKKPPVNFEEPEKEVEVEYIQEPQQEPPPQPKKLKKAPSRMSNIYATAKQMEQERKNSLGYREEDLPKY